MASCMSMDYLKEHLVYLAGIMDGEGTIYMCDKRIMKRKSRGIRKTNKIYRARVNFSTTVTVCNTDERLMSWLIKYFGGAIYISKRQKKNWKQKMTWIMPTKKISKILEGIFPYLNVLLILWALLMMSRAFALCRQADIFILQNLIS